MDERSFAAAEVASGGVGIGAVVFIFHEEFVEFSEVVKRYGWVEVVFEVVVDEVGSYE